MAGLPCRSWMPPCHPILAAARLQPSLDLLELTKRPGCCLGTEIAGVKHLNAGLMIALERRHGARASRGRSIGRGAEPQAQMIRVHRCRRGIRHCVEGIRLRGGAGRGGEDKKLAAENPTKLLTAPTLLIGHDIALIPGHPKRPRRNL